MTRPSALTRREAIAVAAGMSLLGTRQPAARAAGFATLEAASGIVLGVAALNMKTGELIGHRENERFTMCSTFKWMLVAETLSAAEAGRIRLDARLAYGTADLLDYAPVARSNLKRGWMTVEECCAAAIEVSDNTAANLLLRAAGGPAGLTFYLRRTGDLVTRLDRYEPELNLRAAGDERDTTSPEAMVRSMRRILFGKLLRPGSSGRILHWLEKSTRGLARLRAGLPSGWRAGSKAGTNGDIVNDVAVTWPPGRPPILIASYLYGGKAGLAEREQIHAQVARMVAGRWR